jgi:hypothetical protein
MGKFVIYAETLLPINVYYKETTECANSEEALALAEEVANEQYCLNPIRDVLDIMKQDGVGEDLAYVKFVDEMSENTIFYIDEIADNGELKRNWGKGDSYGE